METTHERGISVPTPRYHLTVQIAHPTLHSDAMADALNWEPKIAWVAGEPRKAPNGMLIGGINQTSYWCASEEWDGTLDFRDHLSEIIDFFETRRSFIIGLVRTGGRVTITAQIPGSTEFQSTLSPDDLAGMARLGIRFGVEVFPHMR